MGAAQMWFTASDGAEQRAREKPRQSSQVKRGANGCSITIRSARAFK